ncbi:hypothetical protein D770_26880 [Flammeovirgaceae bacterium 311]|nr:hypothetical protein D770_26880 [Flammeovirgaceae bacterium 311]
MIPVITRHTTASDLADTYFSKKNVLNYVLIVSFICFVGMIIMRFITAYSLNVDLVGVETNVVFSIQTAIAGQSLYNDPMYIPFTITQYTPLYYDLCAVTARLLQVEATDVHTIYVIGRMWNIFLNLLTAYAIYLICSNIFRLENKLSIIAGLCAFVFIFRHDFSVRSDSLQNLFVIWAIYYFFNYLQNLQLRSRSLVYLAVAIFLGVASIFAKQSGIQIPIIFMMFLLFTMNWRGFIIGSVLTLVFFSGFYLYYHSLYGEAFFQNVVGGVANGITLRGFLVWVIGAKPFFLKIFIPFLIVTYIILKTKLLFKGTLEERFLAFCLAGLFGFATVTGLKMGATAQYYGLFQYMAWVLIFYYFGSKKVDTVKEGTSSTSIAWLKRIGIWAFLMGLLAINTLYQFNMIRTDEFKGREHLEAERQITWNVANYLKNDLSLAPGEKVFANLSVAERRGINNALFANAVVPQLEIVHFSMTPLKVFGYDQFDESLRNGTIKYIIDSDPVYHFIITDNFEQLKKNNYKLVKRIDNYSIYQYTK